VLEKTIFVFVVAADHIHLLKFSQSEPSALRQVASE